LKLSGGVHSFTQLLGGVNSGWPNTFIVGAKRGDELGHALVAAKLEERLRSFVEREREPANNHLAALPS
jgi:hypothetical protein